jgi:pimeloyl-ACP methyl ester carboxylesterase
MRYSTARGFDFLFRKIVILIALCAAAVMTACGAGFSMNIEGKTYPLGDGGEAWIYALSTDDPPKQPKAVVFYVGGSDGSVQGAAGPMAGFVMMDMQVLLLERRGIGPRGTPEALLISADRSQRLADALAQVRAILKDQSRGLPVIVVGVSEGADIAALLAANEPRISHLVFLAGGGGMSQAEELRLFVQRDATAYGIGGVEALEKKFEAIRQNPQGNERWLGQPYRRWSSYLWSPPTDALMSLDIPIFMAHGAADRSVPVESARALEKRFQQAGKKNLRYFELEDASHSFSDETGRKLFPFIEVELLAWLHADGVIDKSTHDRYLRAVHRAHPKLFE